MNLNRAGGRVSAGWILMLLVFVPLTGPASVTGQWYMINVNSGQFQGDAHLLVIGDVVVMIDAGYASEASSHVVPYLRNLGIRKIDYFFVSHPHRDHYEGLRTLIEDGVEIENLYYKVPDPRVADPFYEAVHFSGDMAFAGSQGAAIHHPVTGFRLDLPHGAYIELLHAQEGNLGAIPVDVNDLSLVMRLRIGLWTVLFTGDMNQIVGDWIAENRDISADILKVPHHGGRPIASGSFFDAVDPEYAAVPGPDWVWCEERGDIARTWLADNQVPTWINGVDGTVVFEFDGYDLSVQAERPSTICKAVATPNGVYKKPPSIVPQFQLLLSHD